jgi:hypothetical protein
MADTIEIIQGTATTVEVAGPTGPQGPAGAAGATGAQGPQGVPGTGLEVLTTQGDLLYQGASTGQRLPIGTSGQVLKVANGIPAWGAESGAVSSVAGRTGAVTLAVADVAGAVATSDVRLSDDRDPNLHAASHLPDGADEIFDQSLNSSDSPTFAEVSIAGDETYALKTDATTYSGNNGFVIANGSSEIFSSTPSGEIIFAGSSAFLGIADRTDTTDRGLDKGVYGNGGCLKFWNNTTAQNTLVIADNGDVYIGPNSYNSLSYDGTDSSWGKNFLVAGNISARDNDSEHDVTFDVQSQLSDDVTLTIPDQSGTIAVVTDIPTEVTDLFATGISADYVPVAQGDGTIVWEAQSGGGGDTVSIESTAADILSVSSGAISADDAGADRIVYWNNTSNKLTYGTPSDVGAAPTSHTHVVSDVTGAAASGSITTSGLTQSTARILGRTTASTGAVEEIQIGSGLSLSAGELSATGSGVTAVGASTADVLSVSGSDLVADDPNADRIIFWDDSESKLRYLEAGSGLSISGTTMTVTATGGATNLWIPASAFIPKTTAGCGVDSRETTTNDQNFDELLFDTGSDEFADALVVMPSNYNNGTVTARFYWSASSGSGGVAWGIQGRAFANDDALDTAAGTAQLVTDTLIAANDMHITSATSAVTIGGTPAANTPIQFSIYRDVSDAADTLAVDARLLGVEIIFN